jgi:GNAT superfamily N-acetyltransferase
MSDRQELAAATPPPEGVTIRRATEKDDDRVLSLLAATLGWEADARHRDLFLWKHRDNPFGVSPGWVAEDAQGIVGFRALMRWEFLMGDDRIAAVRAVDTATHPRAQGRGIFRTLTLRGVEEMAGEGVSWVFNTPNEKSARGYMSMGWREVGRLPGAIRPLRLAAVPKLISSRGAADLWSLPTTAGEDAASVLADTSGLEELLGQEPPRRSGIRTRRSAAYLLWRFGLSPVGYRVLLGGSTVRDGLVVFRLRRRGRLKEGLVSEILPSGLVGSRARSSLLSRVGKVCGADYLVTLGRSRARRSLIVPGRGPLLTWRALDWPGPPPEMDAWDLSAGDVELF